MASTTTRYTTLIERVSILVSEQSCMYVSAKAFNKVMIFFFLFPQSIDETFFLSFFVSLPDSMLPQQTLNSNPRIENQLAS